MLSVDTQPATGPAAGAAAPAGVSGPAAVAALRSLQHLPEELLRAMVSGIRANADELTPGALFHRRDGGGCAVGVTLRALAPSAFQFGRVEFWLWHRWRRGVELDVARRFPQLQQLQRLFDDAVSAVERAGGHDHPAKAVGLWLADSAEAELRAREAAVRASRRPGEARNRWRAHRAPQLRRAKLRTGTTDRRRGEIETRSWR